MSDNVIDFCKAKSDTAKDRSHHIVSLDLFMNSDSSEPWASVTEVDIQDIDPDWHRFISAQLRRLAWIGDGMAASEEGSDTAPIACITVYEDSRISIIDNDDKMTDEAHLKWLEEQLLHGVAEIRRKLNG